MGILGDVLGAVAGPVVSGLFSKSSAKNQIGFQEYMSGTAHQREVKDLRAAGLNPILSAKYGGASTPTGAGYQMPNIDIPKGISNVATAKNLNKQGQILDKQVEEANIMETILKRFPEIAIARSLAGTSTADKVMATVLNRGGKLSDQVLQEGTNSAQDFKKGKEKVEDNKKGNTLTIPITGGITAEENVEIDKEYLRQQHLLKKRLYQRGH